MPTISSSNDIFRNTAPLTYLAQDIETTGETSFLVTNASDASQYKYIVVEDVPSESFEILPISTVSGNTITTNSSNSYRHNFNTPIYFFDYDQIEFAHSTEAYGNKTVLETKGIQGYHPYTYFYDETNNTGFGHLRLVSSTDNVKNDWSSPVPYSYSRKSARSIISFAKNQLNEVDNSTITNSFGIQLINMCESEVAGMRRYWSWLREDNYVVGQLQEDGWRLTLPKDIYYTNNPGSIISLNYGGLSQLDYLDINQFKRYILSGKFTNLTTSITAGDTVVNGKNFNDFHEQGSVNIGGNVVEYTSRTDTQLQGVTGITTSVSEDASITQNIQKGKPSYYTIWNGQIYVYPIVNKQNSGKNLIMSYIKQPGTISQLFDETIIPDETLVVDYLVYHFDMKINTQVTQIGGTFMQSYLQKIDRLRRQETTGVHVNMKMQGRKGKYKDKL